MTIPQDEQFPGATITTDDGYVIDIDTGEVVGHLEALELPASDESGPAVSFEVTDLHSAEWVLSKLLCAESVAAGLALRKAAIVANIDAQIKEQARRVDWLHRRFDADLRAYAWSEVENAKTKSLVTAYGKLSFRQAPGGITVLNQEAAVQWAEQHCPDAVKVVRSVLVTPLRPVQDQLPGDVFEIRQPSMNFHIDTGISAGGAK